MIRAIETWLPGYLRSIVRRPRRTPGTRHLLFAVADHYEPYRADASAAEARRRVRRWIDGYAAAVDGFRDADGRPPRHTFFYPAEEYDAGVLTDLAALCGAGYGEVEIHLHHRDDTPDGFRSKLTAFRDRLRAAHGCLGAVAEQPVYGFVHGNWALCNARPDGDWCGVDAELGILAETGCYADFTFPSAPSPTQPRTVNALYRAWDRPGRPRGADRGVFCRVGGGTGTAPAAALLIVQGPLGLDFRRRKWGLLPRIENGSITGVNPPRPGRTALWLRQAVHVAGRPEWVFVKLHTHGCVDASADVWLGEAARRMHRHLAACCNTESRWRLHYVTAREMVNIILAAEDGCAGDPGAYRDYRIAPPPFGAR
jgi:hypothetical protein